ncbi:MAG: uroporphyrinogen-III C-methyltransferase, partial [Pseudomonadota bacterium]
VILADHLAGKEVLELAGAQTEIINVGKARGRHSKTQAEIHALILTHAKQGRTVVRLKGGDPFVFGRGGEEVDILRASGVACEVVPGVTAAAAAAASIQVPLTHREFARSVTFLSGHSAGDGAPDFSHIDLAALNNGTHTLAVYMAVATAPVLAGALLDAGWSASTPIIAVERASHPTERRVSTTIKTLLSEPERVGLVGPALILIGEVAGQPIAGDVVRIGDRTRASDSVSASAGSDADFETARLSEQALLVTP